MEIIHVGPRFRVFLLKHLKRKEPSSYGGNMLSHRMTSIFCLEQYTPNDYNVGRQLVWEYLMWATLFF